MYPCRDALISTDFAAVLCFSHAICRTITAFPFLWKWISTEQALQKNHSSPLLLFSMWGKLDQYSTLNLLSPPVALSEFQNFCCCRQKAFCASILPFLKTVPSKKNKNFIPESKLLHKIRQNLVQEEHHLPILHALNRN